MSTSAIDIKASLLTKIQSVSNIVTVNNYAGGRFDDYPAAELTMLGGSSEQRQNVRRLFEYIYRLEVFVEQGTNFDEQKTERIAIETIDQILTVLNADVTLGGGVIDVRPLSWSTSWVVRETDTRVITMDIVIRKLETTSG